MRMRITLFMVAALLAGCAGQRPGMSASEGRALIAAYMPSSVADREGWAADIYSAVMVLEVPLTPDNICAILAVTEQESGFRVDPAVPNLPAIAWAEIERQRERVFHLRRPPGGTSGVGRPVPRRFTAAPSPPG